MLAPLQDADVHVVVGQDVEAFRHELGVVALGFRHHAGYLQTVFGHKLEEIVQHETRAEAQQAGVPKEVSLL